MSDTVIRVENLGKKYRIRHQQAERYTALRDVIARTAATPLRWLRAQSAKREAHSPNGSGYPSSNGNGSGSSPLALTTLPSAEERSALLSLSSSQSGPDASPLPLSTSQLEPGPLHLPLTASPSSEDFWALRDVSFEVKQGEVVGIIGRNGAGKSTLLKILSRITEPTEGRVRIKGRVASLLEVGTGFHPELTGRENIFLNGAVLGMTREEIKQKFDEIVAFAEIEKFLDTPVKRYSSGMYVRLAFAVAAHLEPEILVVDEVLAVGDVEFQKKCLGKMSQVAQAGRTVLFVSHNMAAVKSLTNLGMVLQAGQLVFRGISDEAVNFYTHSIKCLADDAGRNLGAGTHTEIQRARLLNKQGQQVIHYTPGTPLVLEVTFTTDGTSSLSLEALLMDPNRSRLALASLYQFQGINLPDQPGKYICRLALDPLWLASGAYALDLTTSLVNHAWDHYVEEAVTFDVIMSNPLGFTWDFKHAYGYGSLAMLCTERPRFTPVEH